MRILLVGNYALDRQSSMLRYAEMLRRQLTLRGHQVELLQPTAVVGGLIAQGTARKWLGYIDKYLLFPPQLRRKSRSFDLVHICDHSNSVYLPHVAGTQASITCHDLLAVASAQGKYPEQQISATGKVLQRWILKHLSAAKNVVCVSSATAAELRELAAPLQPAGPQQNIALIYNPLNFDYTPAPADEVLRTRQSLILSPDQPYLLHIGGNHWYKNRPGVLRIFSAFAANLRAAGRPIPQLVMAGQSFSAEMRAILLGDPGESDVIELVDPSNESLRALYTGASALLFPSLYEGFGWPLIEAQSCGCPVITSNRAPMTEVAGAAALYIDPSDEPAAAATIASQLDRLPELTPLGHENVRRFDLDGIINQYERFFAAVLSVSVETAPVAANPQANL